VDTIPHLSQSEASRESEERLYTRSEVMALIAAIEEGYRKAAEPPAPPVRRRRHLSVVPS